MSALRSANHEIPGGSSLIAPFPSLYNITISIEGILIIFAAGRELYKNKVFINVEGKFSPVLCVDEISAPQFLDRLLLLRNRKKCNYCLLCCLIVNSSSATKTFGMKISS